MALINSEFLKPPARSSLRCCEPAEPDTKNKNMKEYIVKKGEVHENGQKYKAGDKFFTEPYRAEQLGLNEGKIEEVQTPTVETGDNTADTVISGLQQELQEFTDENTRLKDDNDAKDVTINELTEKLTAQETAGAAATEKIIALEKVNSDYISQLEKAQGELSGTAEKLAAAQSEIKELKKNKK